MPPEDNANNALVVRQKLSLRERIASSEGAIQFLVVTTILGFIAGFGAVMLTHQFHLLHGGISAFLAGFVFAFVVTLGGLVAMSATAKMLQKKRRALMELQQKISEQASQDLCADLQTLVQGYLEIKEYEVADFYSTKLLQQSALPPEERATKLTETMFTTGCWASTPEYHKKPNYWLVWLFESRGTLTITPTQMRYKSTRISFQTDLADIREVTIEHHPRWLKPIPFKYMAVKFLANGTEQCIYITPSLSETDTIFEVNKLIDEWHMLIKSARERRTAARTIEKMKAQIPGVGSEQKV